MHAPWNAQPALLAIKGSDTIAVRKMHDRQAFLGSLGVDVDREMLAAEGYQGSFLNAAGDFLQRIGPADGGDIFVEELIRWRKDGFRFSGLGAFCCLAFRFFPH